MQQDVSVCSFVEFFTPWLSSEIKTWEEIDAVQNPFDWKGDWFLIMKA
jgi:hypothetical protein